MNKFELIIIGLIALVIGLLAYNAVLWYYGGADCMQSPFVYGAKKLTEANNMQFIGSGSFIAANSPIVYFNSTDASMSFPRILEDSQMFQPVNFTNIFVKTK